MTTASPAGATLEAAHLLGELAHLDEPIGVRTTYRVGGAARLFVEVDGDAALDAVSAAVAASGVAVLVLGKGSNLLVSDAGFDGLCVILGDAYGEVEIDADSGVVSAGGAASSPVVARRSGGAGRSGLEWLVGIPGSIGGAVRMNAGGHGSDTAARLVDADVVDLSSGTRTTRDAVSLDLAYRHSNLAQDELVLRARLSSEDGDAAASASEIEQIVRWRRANQPGGRNAGSVFSNPPGDSAGRLIDAVGLKGLRLGSAEVSPKHANFFQADEGGSADDVARLIDTVRTTVAEKMGIVLETELRMIGFSR